MSPRNYDLEDSSLIVSHSEEGKRAVWAVFDVSRTVYSQWIAICWTENNPEAVPPPYEILTIFKDVEQLALWVAHRQHVYHDEIRGGRWSEGVGGLEWLEETANNLGYGGWENFKSEWMEHIGEKDE